MNVFAWWPTVNEKFQDSLEQSKDPLKDLNWKVIESDWGGIYWKFQNKKKEIKQKPADITSYTNWDRKFIKVNEAWNKNIPEENWEQTKSFDTKNWESEILKKNSKYLPIIDRLVNTKQISNNTKNILVSEDLDNIKFDNIEWIPEEEKKVLEWTFFNLESSENNREENLVELRNDSKELAKSSLLWDFDFSIEQNNFNSEVLNKIWKNYLKFPDENGKFDVVEDLWVAINTTKIQILKDVKNIPVNTETYKVAIKNIESNDIKKQLEWIESLYVLAYSKEWELWTTLDKYKKKKKKKLIEEFEKLNKEFDHLAEQKATEDINKRKKEINKRITEIWNEANEIEAWDIFEAWDVDKINNSQIEVNKQ